MQRKETSLWIDEDVGVVGRGGCGEMPRKGKKPIGEDVAEKQKTPLVIDEDVGVVGRRRRGVGLIGGEIRRGVVGRTGGAIPRIGKKPIREDLAANQKTRLVIDEDVGRGGGPVVRSRGGGRIGLRGFRQTRRVERWIAKMPIDGDVCGGVGRGGLIGGGHGRQETRLELDEDVAANQETRLEMGEDVAANQKTHLVIDEDVAANQVISLVDKKLFYLMQKFCQQHKMFKAEETFLGRVRNFVAIVSHEAGAFLDGDSSRLDEKHISKQLLYMLKIVALQSVLVNMMIQSKDLMFWGFKDTMREKLYFELRSHWHGLEKIWEKLYARLPSDHPTRDIQNVGTNVMQLIEELEEDYHYNDLDEQYQASTGFSIQETGETPSFQFLDLKMPILSKNTESAGGRRVTRFDFEVTDVVGELEALSGIPRANLQKQVVTKERVLLVWEQGEEPLPQKVAANSRGTHVVSARLTGVDQNLRGRVGYQFCSPFNDFDLEEESSIQPGRHTDDQKTSLVTSANVLSIKVVDSVKGFPVSLYGSIFVRDSLDNKRVYLFRRDRDNAQHINSPDESLMLNGPSRGLYIVDGLFFEIDLKMIRDQQGDDMDFSQGTISYDNGISTQPDLVSEELWSPLSNIELNYALARRAVEAYIEIQIVKHSNSSPASTVNMDEKKGCVDKLYGRITACITGLPEEMVLFDSDASNTTITVGGDGMLDLWCRIISVPVWDSLLLRLETWDGDGDREADLCRVATTFSPVLCGEEHAIVPCSGYMMQISVFWSPLYIQKLDRELLKGNSCWGKFRH